MLMRADIRWRYLREFSTRGSWLVFCSFAEGLSNHLTAGYTYCAIASLSLLNRLPSPADSSPSPSNKELLPGLTNIPATIRWLVSRQVGYKEEDEEGEEEDPTQTQREALAGVYKDGPLVPGLSFEEEEFVGFNGRCNKMVDTCYAYWVIASLDVSPMDKFSILKLVANSLWRCWARINRAS